MQVYVHVHILCAFQDHLHPRAAATAHVHDAHTHTCPWRGATIYAECALKEAPSSPQARSSSLPLSVSLSLVCFSVSLHFMNYEMCNFYVFLRVFHRSQCAWHLPSCSPSCSPSPSPLQKFHSLPHGVALESQLLLCPICELYAVLSMFPV